MSSSLHAPSRSSRALCGAGPHRRAKLVVLVVGLFGGASQAKDLVAMDAGVRSEAQLIGSTFGLTPSLEVDPTLAFYLRSGRFTALLSVMPRIQLNAFTLASKSVFYDRGRAQVEDQVSREGRLFAYGAGEYGTQVFGTALALQVANPTNAPVTLPPTLQRLPDVATATIRDVRAGGGLDWAFGTHVRFYASGAYTQGGGVDAVSRLAVPLQKEADAQAYLGIITSRQDVASTTLFGTKASFDNGLLAPQRVQLLEGVETWRHLFAKETAAQAGAGVAKVSTVGPLASENGLLPVLQLSGLTKLHGFGALELQLDLQLSPYIDRLTGLVYERANQTFSAAWRLVRDITLTGRVLGAESVFAGSQHGIDSGALQGTLAYIPVKDVKVEASAYMTYQHQPTAPFNFLTWVASVSITMTERSIL